MRRLFYKQYYLHPLTSIFLSSLCFFLLIFTLTLVPTGKIVVFVVAGNGPPEALQTLPAGLDNADPRLPDLTTPLFVLVNGNTASAAEVLSAALQVSIKKYPCTYHTYTSLI